MARSLRALLLGVLVSVLVSALPSPSTVALAAELDKKGRSDAKEALRFYKEGNYEDAAKLFLRLSIEYPEMLVFVRNLGACYYYMRRYEPALSNLRDYLHRKTDIAADDRAEVAGWIGEMERLRDQAAAAAVPPAPLPAAATPTTPTTAVPPLAPVPVPAATPGAGVAATGPASTATPAPPPAQPAPSAPVPPAAIPEPGATGPVTGAAPVPASGAPGSESGHASPGSPGVQPSYPPPGPYAAQPGPGPQAYPPPGPYAAQPGPGPQAYAPRAQYGAGPSYPPPGPYGAQPAPLPQTYPPTGSQPPYQASGYAPVALPATGVEAEATKPQRGSTGRKVVAWLLGVTGGAAVAAGGVFGGLALYKAKKLESKYDPSMEDQQKKYALGSYVCLGVGGAAIVTAIIVGATGGSSGSVALGPTVGPGVAGATLSASF